MLEAGRCPKCGAELPTFGFTWEDVDRILRYGGGHSGDPLMASLADRIAALLSPREHRP